MVEGLLVWCDVQTHVSVCRVQADCCGEKRIVWGHVMAVIRNRRSVVSFRWFLEKIDHESGLKHWVTTAVSVALMVQ